MLRLRPFRRGDAKIIVKWATDEIAFYKWSAGIFGEYPLTEERFLEAMAGRDDNEGYFPFVAFEGHELVGFFIIRIPAGFYQWGRFSAES